MGQALCLSHFLFAADRYCFAFYRERLRQITGPSAAHSPATVNRLASFEDCPSPRRPEFRLSIRRRNSLGTYTCPGAF